MTTTSSQHRQKTRDDRLDALKGFGILLVVFGHALRGVHGAGLVTNEAMFRFVDAVIYSFHMPLFFFLSGLVFFPKLIAPLRPNIPATTIRLVYPIFLWTYLFLLARIAIGSLANKPTTLNELLVFPIPPNNTHLWFLWALFLLHVTFMCLGKLGISFKSLVQGLVVLVATIAITQTAVAMSFPGKHFVIQALSFTPFFVLGLALHAQRNVTVRAQLAPIVLVGSCTVFIALVAFYLTYANGGVLGVSIRLALILCVATAFLALGPLLNGSRVWSLLCKLGLGSMAIYLSHTFFSAPVRIAMQVAGIENVWLHLVTGTLIGLVAPLMLLATARRLHLKPWLGF